MQVSGLKRIIVRLRANNKKNLSDRLKRSLLVNEQLKLDLKNISNILNSLPVPIWERDMDLNIIYQNLAYSMLIEQESDFTGNDSDKLGNAARQVAEQARETHRPESNTSHMTIGDVNKVFQITEIPLLFENRFVGFALDKSTMLENTVEHPVRNTESYTKATAIFGPNMEVVYMNSEYIRLWQIDRPFLDTNPNYVALLDRLQTERKLPEQANYKSFKQSRIKLFSELVSPYKDCLYLPDGRSIQMEITRHELGGLMFSFEDITERLSFERSYNMLSAVQKTVLEHLHEGVAVFGPNGRLAFYNSTYARIWGLDAGFLTTKPHITQLLDVLRPLYLTDDWEQFKASFIRMLSERIACRESIERSDGLLVDRISVPLPDGSMLISYLDITDLNLRRHKAKLKCV